MHNIPCPLKQSCMDLEVGGGRWSGPSPLSSLENLNFSNLHSKMAENMPRMAGKLKYHSADSPPPPRTPLGKKLWIHAWHDTFIHAYCIHTLYIHNVCNYLRKKNLKELENSNKYNLYEIKEFDRRKNKLIKYRVHSIKDYM